MIPHPTCAPHTPRHPHAPKHDGYMPAKFHLRASIGMTFNLFRFLYVLNGLQEFARALNVHYVPQVNYLHGISDALSKSTNAPSLAPLV